MDLQINFRISANTKNIEMTRRKVLVVCMFDSIHAGRWLSQFTDQEIDFILFPSKKFRKIHPKLVGLLKNKDGASFKTAHLARMPRILGYLDFLFIIQASRRNFIIIIVTN